MSIDAVAVARTEGRRKGVEVVYRSADGRYAVRFSEAVLGRMLRMCAHAAAQKIETGGVLFGYYTERPDTAIITNASGPPSGSTHSPTSFFRGTAGLQARVNRFWRMGRYYIGEWHYHPGGPARSSYIDDRQMREIAASDDYACPEPVLAIIGGDEGLIDMSVSVFPRGSESVCLSRERVSGAGVAT